MSPKKDSCFAGNTPIHHQSSLALNHPSPEDNIRVKYLLCSLLQLLAKFHNCLVGKQLFPVSYDKMHEVHQE